MIGSLNERLLTSEEFRRLVASVSTLPHGQRMQIAGVAGSLRAIIVSLLHTELCRQMLVVAADAASAERIHDDINLAVDHTPVVLFTGLRDPLHLSHEEQKWVADITALRFLLSEERGIVVVDPSALLLRLDNPRTLRQRVYALREAEEHALTECVRWLSESGFERKDFVETHGDYSLRGGILDVFSFVGDHPLRIEFSGDTVESIREFDPLSQRSIRTLQATHLVPNLLAASPENRQTDAVSPLTDLLRDDAIILLEEPEVIRRSVEEEIENRQITGMGWIDVERTLRFPTVEILSVGRTSPDVVDFGSQSQPSFNGSINMLRKHLVKIQQGEYKVTLCCDTQSELARLKELLVGVATEDEESDKGQADGVSDHLDVDKVEFSLHAFHEGFLMPGLQLAVYTEHQVFNRLKRRGRQRRPRFRGFSEKEVRQLRRGDYVVHIDYGIGRFSGLERIRVGEVEQEVVKLVYDQSDTLYVNLNYINRIQKYSSREGHVPKLSRLGSTEWEKLKSRAKRRIKDIARDLIQLYAKRKTSPGFVFDPDTPWQKELEASFAYDDTYDQARTTREVKQDMEAAYPMDRLVCGDVGFGKTEVAVRAAFKCVLSGKQAAVLVPTTILALQHHTTFVDRVGRYSTRVEVLSRFKSRKEQAAIIEALKAGQIDVVIGTHRLLSKDVAFKDLGLLIVDEEHRFGVAAKEKLRRLRADVDTLTLTATPIPRTLHFSLLGARDLSIIATPPRNRLPVITEITQYSNDLIVDAVRRELHRGGQVYFVHDRVQTIGEMTAQLQKLLPDLRIRYAHGQMPGRALEEVMVAFHERAIDMLVCTKIIESGLDLPNVNTIIIHRADRFGMAELYQLRGRVGRSNQQAYAYLVVPPLSVLPASTLRRLQALEEFTELGSGFNLAMRDLEIRGAGNLLGAEQSGFIETMGFETYQRILEEAVGELKEQEFQNLFATVGEPTPRREETVVEADCDALIPTTYVENDAERLEIYRRLYGVQSLEQLREIALELHDRFGRHPTEVTHLLLAIEIRHVASRIGARKVKVRQGELEVEFPPEADTRFYDHEDFQKLVSRVATLGSRDVAFKQAGGILRLTKRFPAAAGVGESLQQSLHLLMELTPPLTQ
jgi:transcription-repair coupling factor (superfamily II helicase)